MEGRAFSRYQKTAAGKLGLKCVEEVQLNRQIFAHNIGHVARVVSCPRFGSALRTSAITFSHLQRSIRWSVYAQVASYLGIFRHANIQLVQERSRVSSLA